jgi:amidase
VDSDELAFAGAARQAELIRTGAVSARELTELHLDRIERIDPELNAFRVVLAERALAEADQADRRRAGGDDRPLLGVPVAIKDDMDVAGEITARGSGAYGPAPERDSDVVARLRAAGAVVVGKTNVPELEVMGDTESANWGITRNPWDTDRSAGGSSGGSAAAVAAGLVAAATGSDGAGSIRIPAANCGLFGLKPSRGRVSIAPHADVWHGLAVYGFLTRSVADSALLMDVASTDRPDRPVAEAATAPARPLRIAISTRPPLPAPVDATVHSAVDDTAEVLRSLGHTVERAEIDYGLTTNEATVRFLRGIRDEGKAMPRADRLQRRTKRLVRLGAAFPDALLDRAKRLEGRNAERIGRVFADHDVVLMPVAARRGLRAGQWEGRGALHTLVAMSLAYPYCITFNQTGQPAASVPAGFDAEGLPLSVQLAGRAGDETTLYALAAQLEAERPWAERRPHL